MTLESVQIVPLTKKDLAKTAAYLSRQTDSLPESKKAQVTPFRLRVWAVCRAVPKSLVTTYADIARVLGLKSPRAVGQALRRNPFSPDVPCHRVVCATRSLHGYGGSRADDALARKRALLENEGVKFEKNQRVHVQSMCTFRL